MLSTRPYLDFHKGLASKGFKGTLQRSLHPLNALSQEVLGSRSLCFKGLLHFAALVLLQNHHFKSLKPAGKDILNQYT